TIGKLKVFNKTSDSPEAPGMLLKHYAPQTPVILTDKVTETVRKFSGKKIGVLAFNSSYMDKDIAVERRLSKTNDLDEAAFNLYDALHRLDEENLDIIIAERFPAEGLGRTINDRLERASEHQNFQ
ncbi:MAG: L-threonylcarbamoyladenylate synthase type 1 TsaC, partial [Ferruginibacter sp.]|nr:L-threonylcarbamoyladenylate synthase type 1 TsaC [Ferruginibacter sp.]